MLWLLGLLGKAFPTIAAWLDSKEQTKRALIAANAQVGTAALSAAVGEAQAREETRRAYASSDRWWLAMMGALPTFIAGMAVAVHFAAVCIDSTFGFAWSVDKLPSPMDAWEGSILLGLFGLGGALSIAAMVLGRR